MPIYIPPRNSNTTSVTTLSGEFVTLDTNQVISGPKTFASMVEISISGDGALKLDTYNISGYSEVSWSLSDALSFGEYVSYNMALGAPSWVASVSGKYWSLFGYYLNKDLFTIDIFGNANLSNGSLSVQNLITTVQATGNMLTFDSNGKVIDSKVPVNEFDAYSTTTSLSGYNDFVNYTGVGGNILRLPPATTNNPKSVIITIKNSGTGNISIAPYTGDSIDTLAINTSITMVPQQALTFISNQVNNYILA